MVLFILVNLIIIVDDRPEVGIPPSLQDVLSLRKGDARQEHHHLTEAKSSTMNSSAAMKYNRFAIVERCPDVFQDFLEIISSIGKEPKFPYTTVPILVRNTSTEDGSVDVVVLLIST